jgi:acyl-CoA thioesterase FadM
VLVWYDYEHGRPIPLPDDKKALLSATVENA